MPLDDLAKSFSVKALPHSEAELSGDVPYEALIPYRDRALKELAAEMNLPGFRKGHVPESMALLRVGEMHVLEEAANLFVRDFYPLLVADKKIDAVGRPEIKITKLAPNNPLSLVIQTAVYPEVTLPKDFRALAAKVPASAPEPVTDKEFDEALLELRKSRTTKTEDGTMVEPELNDDFAKSVGSFTSLEDLKTKLCDGIAEEKARLAKDKRRSAIIDALLEKTSVDMPQLFVDGEAERMLAEIKHDAGRFGLSFDEYLKRIEKTEEKMREELQPAAEKRAKLQLMLNALAEQEKIAAAPKEAEREFNHALSHYPDADPESLRIHVETILRNEKVLKLLEAVGT